MQIWFSSDWGGLAKACVSEKQGRWGRRWGRGPEKGGQALSLLLSWALARVLLGHMITRQMKSAITHCCTDEQLSDSHFWLCRALCWSAPRRGWRIRGRGARVMYFCKLIACPIVCLCHKPRHRKWRHLLGPY